MPSINPPDAAAPAALLRRWITASLLLYAIWLLLIDRSDLTAWIAGLVVAPLTALLSTSHLLLLDGVRLRLSLPWHLLRFLAIFLHALVRANFDMARRVISPRLPIDPALVSVESQLQSPLGRLLLANAITLTPGTLTVDVEGQQLQVHWIDSHGTTDLATATAAIAARFERYLKEIVL